MESFPFAPSIEAGRHGHLLGPVRYLLGPKITLYLHTVHTVHLQCTVDRDSLDQLNTTILYRLDP